MYRNRYIKKLELEYTHDVVITSHEQYEHLIGWVKENIPSTERFSPKLKNTDDLFGNMLDIEPQTVRFKFKTEDLVMAFKIFSSSI